MPFLNHPILDEYCIAFSIEWLMLSINKGPKFHQLILDLLIRVQCYKIALIADLEKAFLIIAVDEKDRDVLRFIWIDDVNKEEPKLCVYGFTRVVFGVSSSPFLLNATVKYHLERYLDSKPQ